MNPTAPFNRETWPIAVAMIPYPNILPDGRSVQGQTAEEWAATLADVVDAGFTDLDASDSWLRLADLTPSRLAEFTDLIASLGLRIPGISTMRCSVIDPVRGDEYLAYCHRVIDTAAAIGAGAVSFGLFGPRVAREHLYRDRRRGGAIRNGSRSAQCRHQRGHW
jgi:sugar phosphate isomerase/epimerase